MLHGLSKAVAAALLLSLSTGVAHGQEHERVDMEPGARDKLDRGLEYYGKREYEAALDEFEAGYDIDPRPEFLFAMAQAERLSGDCQSAVVLYRKFLATEPSAMHAEAAQGSLDKCETALSSRPRGAENLADPVEPEESLADRAELAPGPAPSTGASDRSTAAAPLAIPRDDAQPWYGDKVGVTLLGLGVASLGVGATFTALSFADESDAADAPSYDAYVDAIDSAQSRRTIGLSALGLGGALVAGAAIKLFVFGDAGDEDGVAIAPDSRGGARVVWTGRF